MKIFHILLTITLMSCSSISTLESRRPASIEDNNCISSIKDFLISTQYKQQRIIRMEEFRGAVLESIEGGRISQEDGKKLSQSLFLKQLKIDKKYRKILIAKENDNFSEKEIIETFYEAFEEEFHSKENILDKFSLINRSYQLGIPISRRTKLLSELGIGSAHDGRIIYLNRILSEDILGVKNIKTFLKEARFVHMDDRLLKKTIKKILNILENNNHIDMSEAFKKATDKRTVLDTNYLFENLLSVLKIEQGTRVPVQNITSGMEFLAYIKSKQAKWTLNYDKMPFINNHESKSDILGYIDANKNRLRKLSYKEIAEDLSNNIENLSKYSLLRFDYYNNELHSHRIYDQCNWGSCWIQAPVAKFEIEVSQKLGQEINISTDHFYLNIYRSRVMEYFLNNKKKKSISEIGEGGFSVNVDSYAKTFGFLPSNVWRPKTPFHNHNNKRYFQRKLQVLFNEYNTKVKDPALSLEDKNKIRNLYSDKINSEFDSMFGKPPSHFELNGKSYTAQSFYKENRLQGLHDGIVWNIKNKTQKYRNGNHRLPKYVKGRLAYDSVRLQTANKELDELNQRIIESIDSGRAVGAGFRWASGEKIGKSNIPYIDNFTGVMSSPKTLAGESVNARGGGHMVLIIGYELGSDGKIKTYKILNSWGHRKGDNGIYHMDINYFKNFLRGLYLNKNDLLGSNFLGLNKNRA